MELANVNGLREYREALYAARLDILKGGKTGSVQGSFAFENWTMDMVNKEITRTENKIYRLRGFSTKNIRPDFSNNGAWR